MDLLMLTIRKEASNNIENMLFNWKICDANIGFIF